jgi:hypothetical protein
MVDMHGVPEVIRVRSPLNWRLRPPLGECWENSGANGALWLPTTSARRTVP